MERELKRRDSVDSAMAILEALADGPLSKTKVVSTAGLSRMETTQLLSVLLKIGLVSEYNAVYKITGPGRYSLGLYRELIDLLGLPKSS